MQTTLSPAQRVAYEGLLEATSAGNLAVLWGSVGMGRTTILRELHRSLGGAFLTMREFMESMRGQHPLALEEAFLQMVLGALEKNDAVIVDDLHLLTSVVDGCGPYPRQNLLNAPLLVVVSQAAAAARKLVFGVDGAAPYPVSLRAYPWGVKEFTPADYECLCRAYLGSEAASRLDYRKIHRFAPKLNGHQLKGACVRLKQRQGLDTDAFVEYLRAQHMASNVDLGEVQAVSLSDLKGVDDVIESLEAHVILPLENDALAAELGIRPKRGVLLAGPPGTGKTTIGRALAHRLKSKFFLIDGTFISGTSGFYGRIHQVFEAAKQNAPCILFIDDSDVIFENREEMGLYRYLLTMLDGLESESAGRVCVMMTAMDVGALPPALIRSGRIELWLETRLPDVQGREAILQARLRELPPTMLPVDTDALVAATEGLTGADLKRLVEDGKILFAYDKAGGRPLRLPTDYFLSAIDAVRMNKERYAAAEDHARSRA
jgi:ATP-dependent 26S proteasome regulatory subunit